MDTLPDEKISEICESMNIESLKNFVMTSRRNSNICSEVLNKKIDDKVSKDINNFREDVGRGFVRYSKPYPPGDIRKSSDITIELTNYFDSILDIKQFDVIDLRRGFSEQTPPWDEPWTRDSSSRESTWRTVTPNLSLIPKVNWIFDYIPISKRYINAGSDGENQKEIWNTVSFSQYYIVDKNLISRAIKTALLNGYNKIDEGHDSKNLDDIADLLVN